MNDTDKLVVSCKNCKEDMSGRFTVRVQGHKGLILSRVKGLFVKDISTINCHVCPKCGYIELYANDINAILRHT